MGDGGASGVRFWWLLMSFIYINEYHLIGGGQTCNNITCKIDLSKSFYYLFFSFVLLELKPFVLKGKVLGEKF